MTIEPDKAVHALEEALDLLSRAHQIISRAIEGKPLDVDILESYFFNAQCLRDCFPEEGQETLSGFFADAYGNLEVVLHRAPASTKPAPAVEPKQ